MMLVVCDECYTVYDSDVYDECQECGCEEATDCETHIKIECLNCGAIHQDQFEVISKEGEPICKSCYQSDLTGIEPEEGW